MAKSEVWKATENAVARRLGGVRTSHRNLGVGGPDVVAGHYVVEVKHTKRPFPKWLTGGMAQASRYASEGQLALLVLHQLGKRHDEDLVVIRLADFEQWYGAVGNKEEE